MSMTKILICSVFSGRYNHKYIGHEFIDLFPSDSGGWYFYVTPWGCIRSDFGKGSEPDYLVMVETINGKNYLTGIATGVEYVSNCYKRTNEIEIKNENKAHELITYFGKTLKDWFASQPNTLYVSYKLKENGHIYFPKNHDFLEDNNSLSDESEKNILIQLDAADNLDNIISILGSWSWKGKNSKKLIGQSQRSYYNDPSTKFEDKVKELINNGLLVDVTFTSPLSNGTVKKKYTPSILDIIGKQNSENVFSHWLAEYLRDIDFYNFFASKLGLTAPVTSVDVTTELADNDKKRVDITIENPSELVLIENKIHLNIHETTVNGKKMRQLDVYLDSAKKHILKSKLTKTIKTILLCPDYYERYGFAGDPKLWNKSIWKPVYYSQIKDIVDDFMNTYRYKSCKSNEYLYLDEFSNALSLHAKNRPETLRDRVLREIAKKL